MFLKRLEGHENIVTLQGLISAQNDMDMYIITELMESDLHSAIKNNILEDIHMQYIIHQILKAVKYMHGAELIHRDLKPQNILLNADCTVKLCDFGLARTVSCTESDNQAAMTDYVATRWYRAPELLLGTTIYRKEIDIWATACILGEMILRRPVFPGVSTIDQLEKIMGITGKPTIEDLEAINAIHGKSLMDSIQNKQPRPKMTNMSTLIQVFPKGSHSALDFMKKCFQFNPSKRASVSDLLQHDFVAKFQNQQKEIQSIEPINIPLDDNRRFLVDDYRKALYKEVAVYDERRKHMGETQQQPLVTTTTAVTSPTSGGGLPSSDGRRTPVKPTMHFDSPASRYQPPSVGTPQALLTSSTAAASPKLTTPVARHASIGSPKVMTGGRSPSVARLVRSPTVARPPSAGQPSLLTRSMAVVSPKVVAPVGRSQSVGRQVLPTVGSPKLVAERPPSAGSRGSLLRTTSAGSIKFAAGGSRPSSAGQPSSLTRSNTAAGSLVVVAAGKPSLRRQNSMTAIRNAMFTAISRHV